MVLLAGVGMFVANLVGAYMLRGYLTDRLDKDLNGAAHGASMWNPPAQKPGEKPRGWNDLPVRVGELRRNQTIAIKYDSSGKVLSDFFSSTEVVPLEQVKGHANGEAFTVESGGVTYRIKVDQDPVTGSYGVAAVPTTQLDNTVDTVLMVGMGVSGVVLLLVALTASMVVRIGLRPLTRMEAAATLIAADTPPSGEGVVGGRVPDADPHTEPGRLGLALNTMLARIQAALAARAESEQKLRQFLADASHELRTPLTSIRGFAELYRRSGQLDEAAMAEMMSRIEQEASRMGLLVEDLLLLAALDEERPLHAQDVDLLAVAADTIRDAHVRNPLRFVALTSFEPVTVLGDDHRLRQVVTNLVSNALRHTPDSAKVEVRVGRETVGDHDPAVASVGATLAPGTRVAVVEVSDSGAGVPAEVAPLIFERLYRVDPGRARSQGGSGLGLSIVAAIVAAHGGRVELVPTPGGGATFRVLLPGTSDDGPVVPDDSDTDSGEDD
ncbi:sensor histidine kinase [Allocatelliglobosispora scoriae]